MRATHFAVLVLVSAIWGSAYMLVKVALEDVPPLTLVAGRLSGAFLFLFLAMLVTGRSFPGGRVPWSAFAVLGVVNNVLPFTFVTWGQTHIDASLAAILTSSMPLSAAVLAHWWIGERLTVDRALGVLIGFGGVFLLIGPDLRQMTESSTLAQLAVVTGVLGYGVGIVFARRYLQTADLLVTAAGQTLVGAAFITPIALAADRPFDLTISAKTALAWATLAVLMSATAYLFFYWLIRRITATQASMVSYLLPITAVVEGVLILDERLGPTSFVGLAVILLGVWVVNGGGAGLRERLGGDRETAVPRPG